MFGGSSDDWFLLDRPGRYPTIVGEQGEDIIDLRSATEGFDLTLGQDTFGGGHWLSAFEFEAILGSEYDDVLLGPDSAGQEDTVTLYGFSGNDFLSGWDEADLLRGGRGVDTLWGLDGPTLCSAGSATTRWGAGTVPTSFEAEPAMTCSSAARGRRVRRRRGSDRVDSRALTR